MAEETSSFKVTLYIEGTSAKNEIRRFILPNNALADFLLLEEKLKTVFKSLQSLPFSVTWEDREGDEVLISSDEELKIAINVMKGEVYRLKIEVKSDSGLQDENAEVHPGVLCDGCGGKVKGFRYQCIQCRNYDLCSACEMKCVHREHYMIRIAYPIAFPRLSNIILEMYGKEGYIKIRKYHLKACCKGCLGEVKGLGYKCVQCCDYYLCSVCEMTCLHKEHYMIRIPYHVFYGY